MKYFFPILERDSAMAKSITYVLMHYDLFNCFVIVKYFAKLLSKTLFRDYTTIAFTKVDPAKQIKIMSITVTHVFWRLS